MGSFLVERRLSGRIRAGDQPSAAIEGQIKKSPLHEYQDTAGKFDQIHQMDKQPYEPCQQARNMQRADLGDGRRTANHSHVALIEIMERRQCSAIAAAWRSASQHSRLLGSRPARPRAATFRLLKMSQVADDEDFGMPGDRAIGANDHASARIAPGSRATFQYLAETGGAHASRPYDGSTGDVFHSLSGLYGDARFVHSRSRRRWIEDARPSGPTIVPPWPTGPAGKWAGSAQILRTVEWWPPRG